jgi:hypothetical protein
MGAKVRQKFEIRILSGTDVYSKLIIIFALWKQKPSYYPHLKRIKKN